MQIIVHNSFDYPDWSDQSYLLGSKIMAFVGLSPTMTHSTPDLRSLSVRERGCYFRDEFSLLNFRYYTYQNCLTECRMNLTWDYCGCIPLIYVNEYGNSRIVIADRFYVIFFVFQNMFPATIKSAPSEILNV